MALGFAPNARDVARRADLTYDELLVLDRAWRTVKQRAHELLIEPSNTDALSELVEEVATEDSNKTLLDIVNRVANDSATKKPLSLWDRLQGLAKQASLFGFFAYDSDSDAPSPTFFSFEDFVSVLSEVGVKLKGYFPDFSEKPGTEEESFPSWGQLQWQHDGRQHGTTTLDDIVVAITEASRTLEIRENYFYLRSCLSGSSGVAVHTSRWRAVVATSSSSLDVGGGEGRASDLTPQQLAFSLFFQPKPNKEGLPKAETRAEKLIELAEVLEVVNDTGPGLEQDLLDFELAFEDARSAILEGSRI